MTAEKFTTKCETCAQIGMMIRFHNNWYCRGLWTIQSRYWLSGRKRPSRITIYNSLLEIALVEKHWAITWACKCQRVTKSRIGSWPLGQGAMAHVCNLRYLGCIGYGTVVQTTKKYNWSSLKITKAKRTGGMAYVVEHLPSKWKAWVQILILLNT
jgi:hypothetical protein